MRITPRSASNQPVNAQLKFTVPADQPYSQPFWLREPKQGDTYTISDQRLIGLPEDPPLLNLRFGLDADGVAFDVVRPVRHRLYRSRGWRADPRADGSAAGGAESAAGCRAIPQWRRAQGGDGGARGCTQGRRRCAPGVGRRLERRAALAAVRPGAGRPAAAADFRDQARTADPIRRRSFAPRRR